MNIQEAIENYRATDNAHRKAQAELQALAALRIEEIAKRFNMYFSQNERIVTISDDKVVASSAYTYRYREYSVFSFPLTWLYTDEWQQPDAGDLIEDLCLSDIRNEDT